MTKTTNPAGACKRCRVLEIAATAKPLDIWNPTQNTSELQSELLAVNSVMRRFRVSLWHAKAICYLSGLGGAA